MRTTVTINDALFDRVKDKISKLGIGFGDFIERAILRELDQPVRPSKRALIDLPTYGSGGLHPGLSWDKLSQEADDIADLTSLQNSKSNP